MKRNPGGTDPFVYNFVYFLSPKPRLNRFLSVMNHLNKLYKEEPNFDYLLGLINGVITTNLKNRSYARDRIPVNFDLTVGKPDNKKLTLYMVEDEFIRPGFRKDDLRYSNADLHKNLITLGETVEDHVNELILSHGGRNCEELQSRLQDPKFNLPLKEDYGLHQKGIMEFFLKNLYLLKRLM